MTFPGYNSDAYYQPETNDMTDRDEADLDIFVNRVLELVRGNAEALTDEYVNEASVLGTPKWMFDMALESVTIRLKGLKNA